MLESVVSGGQTKVDQVGWCVAWVFGIATGGWMPRGFLIEDGPRPELADRYGARELPTPEYAAWIFVNARDSDATLWFGAADTPGARAAIEECRKLSRSCLRVEEGSTRPSHVAAWIAEHEVRVLNVADNRESEAVGIGARSHSRIGARPHARGQPSGRPRGSSGVIGPGNAHTCGSLHSTS